MTDPKTKEAIISKAFDKWAEKKWFQAIVGILIVYLMLAPIFGPIVYNQINKENTKESVVAGIEQQKAEEAERHRLEFERSKQAYSAAKNVLKSSLESTSWSLYKFFSFSVTVSSFFFSFSVISIIVYRIRIYV